MWGIWGGKGCDEINQKEGTFQANPILKIRNSRSWNKLLHGPIELFSRGGSGQEIGIRDARAAGEHLDASLSTYDHRDAHDRGPVLLSLTCRNVGHAGCGAVARLYLTLLRTTPRLHVLILISPFKFRWHEQRAARRPTFHPAVQELCSALAPASRRETIHHRDPAATPPLVGSARSLGEDDPPAREDRRDPREIDTAPRWYQMVDRAGVNYYRHNIAARELEFTSNASLPLSPLILHCSMVKMKIMRSLELFVCHERTNLLLVTVTFVLSFLRATNKLEGVVYVKLRNN